MKTERTSPTILVVDDSEVVLGVTRSLLEGAGFQVITHARATGCVSLILQTKPDLVLLDVNMPTLTGDAVVKMFDRSSYGGKTVVLLHSSLPEQELQEKVAASGAQGYIRKTDNAYSLLRQVQRWLGVRGSAAQLSPPPTSEARLVAAPNLRGGDPPSRRVKKTGESILFADADMMTLALYRDAAQKEGYNSDFALSTAQAVRKICSPQPPSLVVADVDLSPPGIAHLYQSALEQDHSFRDRFILTASAHSRTAAPALFRGPILRKPVDAANLCRTLRAQFPLAEASGK